MGEKADLETAEAVLEQLEEVTLPELEETLAATIRTVEWLKEQIRIKKGEA